MTPDDRYASWVAQLELIIHDVYSLNHHRHLYRDVRDMAVAAELPSSTFFDALSTWYAASQSSAIRRLVDRRRGTVSLVRLLDEIAQYRTVMSRARHVALWSDDPMFEQEGHRNYDRFADRSGDSLDRAAVRADIELIENIAAKLERYVNEHVAHRAVEQVAEIPTFAELHEAIDAVGEIVKKYSSLLQARMLAELEPVIQDDWLAPFRRPWLTPEQ